MYVCVCNAVTDSQIIAAVDAGHTSLRALRDHLGVAAECGRCARCAHELVKSCKGCGKCDQQTASCRHESDHPAPHEHRAPARRAAEAALA